MVPHVTFGNYLAFVPLNPPEALAQRQIVADGVPPASGGGPVVRKAVDDPLVDPFHREQLVGRVFYRHEDQTAERVGGLVQGGGERFSRQGPRRLRLFGQQADLGQWLEGEQVASPLMQPAQTGEVVLVG